MVLAFLPSQINYACMVQRLKIKHTHTQNIVRVRSRIFTPQKTWCSYFFFSSLLSFSVSGDQCPFDSATDYLYTSFNMIRKQSVYTFGRQ